MSANWPVPNFRRRESGKPALSVEKGREASISGSGEGVGGQCVGALSNDVGAASEERQYDLIDAGVTEAGEDVRVVVSAW